MFDVSMNTSNTFMSHCKYYAAKIIVFGRRSVSWRLALFVCPEGSCVFLGLLVR